MKLFALTDQPCPACDAVGSVWVDAFPNGHSRATCSACAGTGRQLVEVEGKVVLPVCTKETAEEVDARVVAAGFHSVNDDLSGQKQLAREREQGIPRPHVGAEFRP